MKFISAIVAFSAVAALVQAGGASGTVSQSNGLTSGTVSVGGAKRELFPGFAKTFGLAEPAQAESVSAPQPGVVAKRDVKIDAELQVKINAIVKACIHAAADVKVKAHLAAKILAEIKAKVGVHIDAKLELEIKGKLITDRVVVLNLM